MATLYDRIYRVPVWVVLDLPKKTSATIIEKLIEDGVFHQEWPSKTFLTTVKEMGTKGWSHITSQKKPFNLDTNFLSVAASKHVKEVFGENTLLSGHGEKPYQQLPRRIETDADYITVFNAVLANEGDIALSQVFGLATPKAKVYVTEGNSNRQTITRIASKTLTVSETDGNIVVKGKKVDEIYDIIIKEIENALK